MSCSGNVLYETLGHYIDSLSHSIHVGTARGRVIRHGEGRESPPREGPLPLIHIFYSKGTLEVIVTREGGRGKALRLTAKASTVRVKRRGNVITLVMPSGKDVILLGNRGLGKTLESVVKGG